MNPMQLGAMVALLVAAALSCVRRASSRAPRSLAVARRRMLGGPSGDDDAPDWSRPLATGAPGRWVQRRFGAGLVTARLTPAAVVTKAVSAMAIIGLVVLCAVAALSAAGMLPVSSLWLLLPVLAALLAGLTIVQDVAGKVARAGRELRRATNDFVQLVAVGLTTDLSVEEAVGFSLAVGAGEGFDMLRDEVLAAPQRGVPLWEAIDEFGTRHEVRELCEFASSLERQGMQGVSIGDTVGALATAMRGKALDQLERDADRANANLSGPTVGFVVATIVFLAYPLAQRISEAFAG